MTEIVSRLPFCRLQDRFALGGQSSGGRTGTSMVEIIEEAIDKYLSIIKKKKRPKKAKKKGKKEGKQTENESGCT